MTLHYFNQFSSFLHGITFASASYYLAWLGCFGLGVLFGHLFVQYLAWLGFFDYLSGRFAALRDKFARHEEVAEEKPEEPTAPAAPSAMIHVPAGQRSIESLALEFYILAKKEFIQHESLPRLEAEVPTLEEAIAYLAAKQPLVLSNDVSVEHF